MGLSYDEIAEILKIIDSSSCDELIVETGDVKLVVRRNNAGAPAAYAAPAASLVASPAIVAPASVKPVAPPPSTAQTAAVPELNIPLKYYGFAKPIGAGGTNRGFFLDGDNILIASEGQLLKQKYLVVELTPISARVEDTEVKKGKALPLEPEAKDQFNPGAGAGVAVDQ